MIVIASSKVTSEDLKNARLGPRFGRLDLSSQLAVLAVESLGVPFENWARERIGICLAARAGSLSTDIEFWKGRDAVGGPSPTLFAYTLPSAAIGEIAIRYKLMGPNLCLIGSEKQLASEAESFLDRGEADACVCVASAVISGSAAQWSELKVAAEATAQFVTKTPRVV